MPVLTEIKIKNLKPCAKAIRYFDGNGLYLEVSPAGGKLWRMKYRIGGKEKRLSFGQWPTVSLKEAREKCEDAKRLLRNDTDPAIKRATEKSMTFSALMAECFAAKKHVWTPNHLEKNQSRMALHVLPFLGDRQVADMQPTDILAIIRRIEARGVVEVPERVLGLCSMVFQYGVATGVVPSDPCRDLRGALVRHKRGHFAAITDPAEAGRLMLAIEEYSGSLVVRSAIMFSALTFARPGEVRQAEWAEIDFDKKVWTIPAEKMKMRMEHKVPLSRQALAVLAKLKPLTGDGKYVFPSERGRSRPISDGTVRIALRSMGYAKEEMTAHGFRSMASTLLNELGQPHDVIEMQLAHAGYDKIRAIYNRAEYWDERERLMQFWADYLEGLKC